MASSTLIALPPELHLTITENISRPSDLKSLCLSCKPLRNAALPQLYRTVTINLDQCRLPTLNGFFVANNAGRAHTRCIIFKEASLDDAAMAWRTMSMTLQYLARDSLREIRYRSTQTVRISHSANINRKVST